MPRNETISVSNRSSHPHTVTDQMILADNARSICSRKRKSLLNQQSFHLESGQVLQGYFFGPTIKLIKRFTLAQSEREYKTRDWSQGVTRERQKSEGNLTFGQN